MALIEGFTHQQFKSAAEQLHAAGGVFLLARPRSILDLDGATETECAVCGRTCWKTPIEPDPLPVGVFPVCTDCMVRQRRPLPATAAGIRVFVVNDYDCVAASTESEARDFYLRFFGLDPARDQPFAGWEGVLCDDDLRRLVCVDDEGERSFADQLQRLIDAGQAFPCFFSSSAC